jgi:Ca2+-transporting ATPase
LIEGSVREKWIVERVPGLLDAETGLTASEVEARRLQYGRNDIVEVPGNPWRELARETAADPMIWFLFLTAGLYLGLGSTAEALTLFGAILPLAGMDAYLHRRTQASTEGLRQALASQANVLREGSFRRIAAVEVVPGDLAKVSAGEAFPADGVLVRAEDVQVDESSLTGEAYPVRKLAGPDRIEESVQWGFAGTRVLTGTALLRVVLTGKETLYGAVVQSAAEGAKARTPLQREIDHLVRILLSAAALLCVILAAVRVRQGHGWIDALISAATLGVAALPEEFPVVFTVFLGVGVYRLARRNALVRRAVSVENVGRVTCICTDKTGTLTEGRLRLGRVVPAGESPPSGVLELAALASRAENEDPVDRAILERAGSPLTEIHARFPFTANRRRETALAEKEGRLLAATKGSPEVVLAMCALAPEELKLWKHRIEELGSSGARVIACASKSHPAGSSQTEPEDGYEFAGLLVLEDPLRAGAREAVETCGRSGIRVLMVTGDHPATARSVAAAVGLGEGAPRVLSGQELEGVSTEDLAERLEGVDVIARAMPHQKLALVQALQAAGEMVVVTGDGVNDVPALQAADVGVAMGERGTRSAREVASIVLLDDNFESIVAAVSEGRQLFRNLQLSFHYLLAFHIPLVLTATLIPLAGYPLLYLPIHIVWLEAIIHPTALLVFQELPRQKLEPVKRTRKAAFFERSEWLQIALAGALGTLLVFVSFARSLGDAPLDVEHARATALVSLVAFGLALTVLLSGLRSRGAWVVTVLSCALSALLVETPRLSALLRLSPLHIDDWGIAIAGGFLAVFLPEALARSLAGPVRSSHETE